MKVKKIVKTTARKLVNGTLPDIDTDFPPEARPVLKNYMKKRFGETQVCSVGTFQTMQLKGLIKDLYRTVSKDFAAANYITSIIDKDDTTFLDLIKRAAKEPKLKEFLKKNSDIVYQIIPLLGQIKSSGIHACAMIIFPDVLKANEWAPMREQKGMLISEWGGGEMDDAGFLKQDNLGLEELSKFNKILNLVEENGKEIPDIYNLPHDKEVFRYFSNGWNNDVFQMGSDGLIAYAKSMRPKTINDLIVTVAIYRPGPMQSGYHEAYAKCKNEGKAPEYLWGTEEITKETFGLLIYQEQVMKVFQKIGDLTLLESDDVRRAMGKKKLSVLLPWKTRVAEGAKRKGASDEEFEKVWGAVEEFAKYGFNKSHAASYAKTAYVCQYLKVHFPVEFWTVSLDRADDTAKLRYLAEISQTGSLEVAPPDINFAFIFMRSNDEQKKVFWGLGSIKGIGDDTAEQIILERDKNGLYEGLEDFIKRHTYKGSKVKKTTYEALISSGAFDSLSLESSPRGGFIKQFREIKKVKIAKPERDPYTVGQLDKPWWWLLKQKELTGLAIIDYKTLAKNEGIKGSFCTDRELSLPQDKGLFRLFGGYVVECKISSSRRGKFARLTIESNYKIYKLIVWSDEYLNFEHEIDGCEKSLIIFTAFIKFEAKWTKGNQFTLTENSFFKSLRLK